MYRTLALTLALAGCTTISPLDLRDDVDATFCEGEGLKEFSNNRSSPLYFRCTNGAMFLIPPPDITYDSVGIIYDDFLDIQESVCRESRVVYFQVTPYKTIVRCADRTKATLRGTL